jgi:hypothetical protein
MASMSMKLSDETKSFLRKARPLIIALVLGLLYIYAIHPSSGMLGGLFFWLAGWMVPSAINLLLSFFVLSFLPIRRRWKIPAFVAISFVLGMNTLLVPLLMWNPPQPSSADIRRPLHVKPGERVDAGFMSARIPGEINGTQSPSPLGVQIAGNEGCMCMWFTPPAGDTTEWQVWHVINAYLHRSDSLDGGNYFTPGVKMDVAGSVHFDSRFTRGKRPETVDLLMTVYDGTELTATFTQSGIPVWTTAPESGHPDRISTYQFLPNVETMLLRHNFWVFMFDRSLSGFSRGPLRDFLKRAVVRD